MNAARACILALAMCWAFAAAADVAVPPLSGRVVDQTGTLSSGDIASLTETLKSLEARKGSQVAVLIVPTTEPETIEQYSIRVVDQWKLGRKGVDDGALLLVAKDDHKARIEVGRGLEGVIPDATATRAVIPGAEQAVATTSLGARRYPRRRTSTPSSPVSGPSTARPPAR